MNILQFLTQLTKSGNTPQQIVETMIRNNPNGQMIVNQIRNSGLTPQQFAEQLAKQNNIDLNNLQNILRQSGIKL